MTKERISIVGQGPPDVLKVEEAWVQSIVDSTKPFSVGFLRARHLDGSMPPEMCRRAWQANDSTVLVYTDESGEEQELPVIAVRTSGEDGETVHEFWVKLPEE
ncbi:hypothetical protein IH980_01580 [Patescibacteria group bacterium]|nr:hypothetical protein [Patescibacteria group bacterium]